MWFENSPHNFLLCKKNDTLYRYGVSFFILPILYYTFSPKIEIDFFQTPVYNSIEISHSIFGFYGAKMKNFFTSLFAIALISCSANSGNIASAENWRKSEMKIEIQFTNESGSTTKLSATLAENPSAKAFAEKLQSGAITVKLEEYGNFEKVGSLPFSLPRNDTQISTEPGDIILYSGSNITIFYNSNSWSYTRLGKLDALEKGEMSKAELKNIFGKGDVKAVISLVKN